MRLLVLGLLLAAVLCGASLTNTAFEPIYTAVCTLSSTKSSGATAGEGFPVHPAAVPLEHWCCNRWNVTATVFAVRPPGRLQPVHLTKGLKPMFVPFLVFPYMKKSAFQEHPTSQRSPP